ncbi:MAG: protein kinase [Thermoanaerobaculia bacterium]|nr:protein kinase [Thermoanaerobaculia bacterium]
MTLAPGARLGPYEITAKLGEGGMGVVFRAKDAQLGREVAVKVLPEGVTQDVERLQRFEREARLLAQLNHPNIAQIYGFEASGDTRALIMELVEGPTLAERLESGALPFKECLSVSLQIAQALEEAHEKGIVHRDLKPQNIKASIEGKVKVLDFGLAKALDPAGVSGMSPSDLAQSPTMTFGGTREGVILGTAAYMAPEQARGLPVDRRADIWAFGVVLFEMLSGRSLFAGETVPDTLVRVLQREIDFDALPEATPPAIRALLGRCLERDPKRRLRDIGEARWLLESGLAASPAASVAAPSSPGTAWPRWRRAVPWLVAAMGVTVGVLGWIGRPASRDAPAPLQVSRFNLALPAGEPFFPGGAPGRGLAISGDGRQIAYRALAGRPNLRLRDLSKLSFDPIGDSDEFGTQPFFSPDGEWVAYFSGDALRKVAVDGGRPTTLARGFPNAGWMLGTWCDDGTIVFDTWNAGLRAVGADGGAVRTLTAPTDEWHLAPQALPGPCQVLFFTQTGTRQNLEVLSLADGSRRRILDDASHGRYVASGHLLFVRDGSVRAVRFDLERLEVVGSPVPLPFEVGVDAINTSAPTPQLGVSRNGTLVYAPAPPGAHRAATLVRVTRDGVESPIGTVDLPHPGIELAPDGERMAISGRREGTATLVSLDLERRATTSLVDLEVEYPASAVWSADGRSIFYSRYDQHQGEIVRRDLDHGDDEILVRIPGSWFCPWSASPDGRYLVFSAYDPNSGSDLWLLDLERAPASDAVRLLVSTDESEYGASISPDGRWFAYAQERAGGGRILAERFPSGGEKTLVAEAGENPRWSGDGREVFFTQAGESGVALIAVPVDSSSTLRFGKPRELFAGRYLQASDMGRGWAAARDGRSFVMVASGPGIATSYSESSSELVVVENWFTELRALIGDGSER